MSAAPPLSAGDLATAAALMLGVGACSVLLRLGLERQLATASLRTVAQLLLVGLVLERVFAIRSAWAVALAAAAMIAMAGRAAVARSQRTFSGAALQGTLSLAVVGIATTWLGSAVVIGAEPFWAPRYAIPLLGMLLGNALTGVSLCLDTLLEQVVEGRDRIELELSLGATRWEAARGPVARAVRRGLIPIVNSMSVVGIVALPGMMTGQILAGESPLEAVRYQIVIMFLIAASTSLGAVAVALLAYRALFNRQHQLLAGRVRER